MKAVLGYITGSGHSGSTLLNMLLGAHPQISALGEAHRLYMSANMTGTPHLCSCGSVIRECEYWQRVEDELRKMTGSQEKDFFKTFVTTDPRYLTYKNRADGYLKTNPLKNRYPVSLNRAAMVIGSRSVLKLLEYVSSDVRLHQRIASNSLTLFEAVRRSFDTPVVIDSTKNPARMQGLRLNWDGPFKIVFLTRDGRAVCYSRMHRENMSMFDSARIWKAEQQKLRITLRNVPKEDVLLMRYEDLCTKADRELQSACAHFGVRYDPAMLDFRGKSHCIGGNLMRLRHGENTVQLDEKWRRELSAADVAEFDRVAGTYNRELGYDD